MPILLERKNLLKYFPNDFNKFYKEVLQMNFSSSNSSNTPITVLGKTFKSDEERRAYFTQKLREKLPELKQYEGFPLAKDEDILALSDPPFYTACPNPWVADFIREWEKEKEDKQDKEYMRKPFAADVSEGKNDPIYNAHSYHTKVPHKAVMRYILHYTDPGDIIFDGFCGTGMTGVAAQLCGDKKAVESLGYKVLDDGTILNEEGKPFSKLGARRAILNDLSPAATFIAYNYNTPVDVTAFKKEAERILKEVEAECGWMYKTLVGVREDELKTICAELEQCETFAEVKAFIEKLPAHKLGKINYTVWSDVFVCPHCSEEMVFWDVAVDKEAGKVKDKFNCPHCGAEHTKKTVERAWETKFDQAIGKTIKQAKQVPVLINYTLGNKRYEKTPDAFDLTLLKKIEEMEIPYWYPKDALPIGYNTAQPMKSHGITHVHHFYTKRALCILAKVFDLCRKVNKGISSYLLFTFEQAVLGFAKLNRYSPHHFSQVNRFLTGTLYIGSQVSEVSLPYFFLGKINRLIKILSQSNYQDKMSFVIETHSTHNSLLIPKNSIDYIFTDPPFGDNLMYSELNFLWEAWLRVFTNNKPEAVINKTQGKGLAEYQRLMEACFKEYYRVLKPGRWMTVEFHNSKNKVWIAIQEALLRAGFVIADVRTLDKKQGSFKQVTSSSAVKQDLIISCYKPNDGLEERFKLTAGTEEGVWDFVRSHLKRLPVFSKNKAGEAEVITERQAFLLYDRMVAFHVQRGATVPLSAAEFYAGLKERFPERDGMYFLPDQVVEYDKERLRVKKMEQVSLFVTDEKTAIEWLRQLLKEKPMTYQEIYPLFTKELHKSKHEDLPELGELLEQNFLQDEKERWYVPDPNKASDLEKLREKALLKDFKRYVAEIKKTGKRLKTFRSEAIRAGFKKCWAEQDYQTIILVAEHIPESVLQEDATLLMYYDNALMRDI